MFTKKKICILLGAVVLFLGVIIFCYPAISNYREHRLHEDVIKGYKESITFADNEILEKERQKAEAYNRKQRKDYWEILNLEGNGVMGYIEIPKIEVQLPIYHGSEEKSLEKGVGHIEKTPFPIGGQGNHSVLTGHRGLPSAELFTRLDELEIGDIFLISILNKTNAYVVDQIQVVLPEEADKIEFNSKNDFITLVTCTPYGENSHRLLIRGERTTYITKTEAEESGENGKINIIKTIGIATAILFLLIGMAIFIYPKITDWKYRVKVENLEEDFEKQNQDSQLEKLYKELVNQNEKLYKEKQSGLRNLYSYQHKKIDLSRYGIENNIIGFLEIPKMDIKLPIYLGATEENMKKGTVHLTETSYPIGGKNTNSVLAAHRGYSRTAMFRDIEKLKKGDIIYVENFREKLVYKVKKYRVIRPTDIKSILIQEKKELLTLLTCHPYRHNYQRYVVICERIYPTH